jgi:hypothetical protein
MLMVQWPWALMVTPLQVSAALKSPAALPVIVTLLIVRGAGFGLTTSMVWTALAVPTRCRPKSTASALGEPADGTGDGDGLMKPGALVPTAMGRGVTVERRMGGACHGGVAVRVGGIVGRGVGLAVGRALDIVAGRRAGVLVGGGATVAVGRAVGATVGSGVGVFVGRGVGIGVGSAVGVHVDGLDSSAPGTAARGRRGGPLETARAGAGSGVATGRGAGRISVRLPTMTRSRSSRTRGSRAHPDA